MNTLVVVTQKGDWPLELPGIRIITARDYLTDPEFSTLKRAKVFNLCRHYRYQALGYYVSLLAEARGHKAIPTVMTMQDLRTPTVVRLASEELENAITRSLATATGERMVIQIYFGRTPVGGYDQLTEALFHLFPAPLLRATFARSQQWELQSVTAVPTSAIPDEHRTFAFEAAHRYFTSPARRPSLSAAARFDIAILTDPDEGFAPSDKGAIDRFLAAAEGLGMAAEVIERGDYGRLAEFDALFIRATTAVDHFTYRFSRRAAAEGLVVIDDPVSILRCTNKVYLAELLRLAGIPTPRTLIVHRDNSGAVCTEIGCPCILKRPDSSSSQGVFKVDDQAALESRLQELFETSDLLIAQEFMPTEFDWRIGVLDREPLFAAKYFMAPQHWQIIQRKAPGGPIRYGRYEVMPIDTVPPAGVAMALAASTLVGDGLYGVDLKQIGDTWVVIEVNDCPNIEHRVEDQVLKDDLYRRIMGVFLKRLEARATGKAFRSSGLIS